MNELISVHHTARSQSWTVVAFLQEEEREGLLPHGHIIFERTACPFPDRPFGVAAWAVESGVARFDSGEYDLDREGAKASFANRAGLTQSAILHNVVAAIGG